MIVGAALGGQAGRDPMPQPQAVDLSIEGTVVCAASAAIGYDEKALAQAVSAAEIEYDVTLPGEGAETEVFFSDLSHQYVTINAEYTT